MWAPRLQPMLAYALIRHWEYTGFVRIWWVIKFDLKSTEFHGSAENWIHWLLQLTATSFISVFISGAPLLLSIWRYIGNHTTLPHPVPTDRVDYSSPAERLKLGPLEYQTPTYLGCTGICYTRTGLHANVRNTHTESPLETTLRTEKITLWSCIM